MTLYLLAQTTAPTTQAAAELLISSRQFWLPIASSMISAALIDLHGYTKAEPNEPFIWRLFLVRMVIALLTGLSISLGINAVPPR